jgi:hypothetical protein
MQQIVPCQRCGQPNQPGQRFCWHCGSTLTTGCPNCGAALDPGSRFCANCGLQMPMMQQQAGWGQPPPQQQAGWGQPPPQQQAGWGQPPPPQQQADWGPPSPQQSNWNPPGSMPASVGAWGQAMPRKSGVSGLVILLVVLLIALGAFTYLAFSDNPPWGKATSTGTTTSAIPITAGPFFFPRSSDASTNKVTLEIQWETSTSYKGQVEYGKTETYGSTTTLESDFTKTHKASLSNLDMSSTYHYRIVLKDKDNEVWKSDDSRFNTPAPATSQ